VDRVDGCGDSEYEHDRHLADVVTNTHTHTHTHIPDCITFDTTYTI